MTYEELDAIDKQLLFAINQLEGTRQQIVAKKHKLQGSKRAGLYPGQLDNHIEYSDADDCET